jgi:hypothetical protein
MVEKQPSNKKAVFASIFIHGDPSHIYPSFIWTTIIIRFESASSKVAGEI